VLQEAIDDKALQEFMEENAIEMSAVVADRQLSLSLQ